jgi:hypothetical protein
MAIKIFHRLKAERVVLSSWAASPTAICPNGRGIWFSYRLEKNAPQNLRGVEAAG